MLRRVLDIRIDVSEKRIAFIIRVTRLGELGTTLTDDEGDMFIRNVCSHKSHTTLNP
jgi:hypothetical protein